MIAGQRVLVVMPAYNAVRTLAATIGEIDRSLVDRILVVDDASTDGTAALAHELRVDLRIHERNRGYGANQKTCYAAALASGEDLVVMVHADYQYTPRLLPAITGLLASGLYDVVLGSRILGNGALAGGMPRYKYVANRFLTAFENLLLGAKLSEYHTGYRGFRREVLARLPLAENSDDFLFDNQMLVQALAAGLRVGEVSCPTRYFAEASSIGFARATRYGLGVLAVSVLGALHRAGLARPRFLAADGRRLEAEGGAQPAAGRAR
jgi:glycosyltransferase involved in cell wall biosynthesis